MRCRVPLLIAAAALAAVSLRASGVGASAVDAATTSATSTAGVPATAALSGGQARVAKLVAESFVTLAGSRDNAIALVAALRTGTPATLTYVSPVGGGPAVTSTVAPPTGAMSWGNVSHALTLAQYALARAGIDAPGAAELQAALNGGTVVASDGRIVVLAGVLRQRASGMGWKDIARSCDTSTAAPGAGSDASTATASIPPAPASHARAASVPLTP